MGLTRNDQVEEDNEEDSGDYEDDIGEDNEVQIDPRAPLEIVWTISPKPIEVIWENKSSFEYTGLPQSPTARVEDVFANESIEIAKSNFVNVGTHTSVADIISVTGGQGKGSNYTLMNSSKEFEIIKANPKITLSRTEVLITNEDETTVTYTYNGDGEISVSSSNENVITVEVNTQTKTITITRINDGTATVTVSASAGTNYNATSATIAVKVQIVNVAISNMLINDGATITKNIDVVVELDVGGTNAVSKMYISENNTLPAEPEWVDYAKYSLFRLSSGNTEKTVYAWVKDSHGNVSNRMNKSITLNMTYSLTLTNNQTYSSNLNYTVYYTKKEEGGEYSAWQQENVFTGLVPGKVYVVKTKLEDTSGLSKESQEFKFKVVYNESTNSITLQGI